MMTIAESKTIVTRPFGIFLISLWSVMRACALIYDLYGQYSLYHMFDVISGIKPESTQFDVSLFLEYIFNGGISKIFPLVLVIIFIVISIGLLLGKARGRSGFLTISALMIFWNLGKIDVWGGYSYPLYSFAAFMLAYWYLRQPKTTEYFGIEIKGSKLFERRILKKAPLDLTISLGIFSILIILDLLKLMAMILLGLASAG